MTRSIRSKVVKIGSSRGIRIPKAILEQAGLADEVEIRVDGNRLIIRAANFPRRGWEEKFATIADQGMKS